MHRAKALHMQVGTLGIAVDGGVVQPEDMANNARTSLNLFASAPSAEEATKSPDSLMAAMTAPLKVEAVLPAGVREHFEVAFDCGAKTMTLAAPGTLDAKSIAHIVIPGRALRQQREGKGTQVVIRSRFGKAGAVCFPYAGARLLRLYPRKPPQRHALCRYFKRRHPPRLGA